VRRYGGAVLGYTASSLGVDLGTTHTVASLAVRGTQVQQLLFDSSPLLSSAVFAEEGRPLVAGRDAERGARLDPTRFEPNPKRRIDDGTVLLGTREYPVAELLAAILRRVASEAGRVGGGSPGATVLTYPANWATTRRTVLAEAAHLAGLRSLTLVPEPVAAAAYFTTVLGRPVPAGAGLVVYDFGAGTFDTSVLRRRADQGWDVLASDGVDVGGLDLDAVLVDLVGEAMSTRDTALWTRLRQSDEESARRARRALWDDARAAKEQLSRAPSAAVHVPLFDTNAHVTREQFEERARPWIARTVELTEALLARTGLAAGQVAGLFLVGGSSRIRWSARCCTSDSASRRRSSNSPSWWSRSAASRRYRPSNRRRRRCRPRPRHRAPPTRYRRRCRYRPRPRPRRRTPPPRGPCRSRRCGRSRPPSRTCPVGHRAGGPGRSPWSPP
jgi:molecular chaperone DnaK (HSP70)